MHTGTGLILKRKPACRGDGGVIERRACRWRIAWLLRAAAAVALGGGAAMAYLPPEGYAKTGGSFAGSAMAFAPDGKVAVATDNISGGATIRVYPSLAGVGGAPLASFTDPTWKFIAGIEFIDGDTLVFGENGDRDTVFKAGIAAGAASALVPDKSIDAIADLAIAGPFVYAATAGGPGRNDVIRVVWDDRLEMPVGPLTVIDDFGTGYGGGVAIGPDGQLFVTDSNGFGVAGLIRRFDASFGELAPIDLSAGGGTGAVDLVFDSEGDLLVSTGPTLTQVRFGEGTPIVEPFGSFSDPWAFPTYLAYDGSAFEPGAGDGVLLVSGFTEEPGIFGITPVPEPAAMMVMGAAVVFLSRRGKEVRR